MYLHPIMRGNQVIAAKVVVYGGDDDEYFSFITPEAYHSINDWMTYRRECNDVTLDLLAEESECGALVNESRGR
jgi:hypothetical protein